MTKTKDPFLYKTSKLILGPIFKRKYKPYIIGLENIPEDGKVIFAGNHIHLFDQCAAIVTYKRFITYMAKDEYFKNWKTKWFFKSVGCIPVDRTKKDPDAVNKALEVLNNDGALGIFPEGTRNALKEQHIFDFHKMFFPKMNYNAFKNDLLETTPKLSELNYLIELLNENKITRRQFNRFFFDVDNSLKLLVKNKTITQKAYYDSLFLPLKFGTVSFAHKTSAPIVPVIISGEYKKGKHIIVNFGKPIIVGDDLEDANKELRTAFCKLVKENEKYNIE